MSVLKDKAYENQQVAEWAEKNKYYHIAISRYYYSLYQKLLHINSLKKLGIPKKCGQGSHYDFVKEITEKLNGKVESDEASVISSFLFLIKMRQDADYEDMLIDNKKYMLNFKYSYININSALDNIIRRG